LHFFSAPRRLCGSNLLDCHAAALNAIAVALLHGISDTDLKRIIRLRVKRGPSPPGAALCTLASANTQILQVIRPDRNRVQRLLRILPKPDGRTIGVNPRSRDQ